MNIPLPELACTELVEVSKARFAVAFDTSTSSVQASSGNTSASSVQAIPGIFFSGNRLICFF
jgi:hypothetical protein